MALVSTEGVGVGGGETGLTGVGDGAWGRETGLDVAGEPALKRFDLKMVKSDMWFSKNY